MSLYEFGKLSQFLDSRGFPDAKAGSFQVRHQELLLGMQNGEIAVRKDGIYLTVDGYDHRGYIFNQKPDISRYKIPKFHVAECEIVENRKSLNGDYIWTNTENVQLYDRGNGGRAFPQQGELTTLQLCSKCRQLIEQETSNILTTGDFHNYLLETYGVPEPTEPVKTDVFGYTSDWSMISRRYRTFKNYVCERCRADLSVSTARRYLHVHHRSGRKTDNRIENLECLCIRCHATTDQRHQNNFERPINRRELEAFNQFFPVN